MHLNQVTKLFLDQLYGADLFQNILQ